MSINSFELFGLKFENLVDYVVIFVYYKGTLSNLIQRVLLVNTLFEEIIALKIGHSARWSFRLNFVFPEISIKTI